MSSAMKIVALACLPILIISCSSSVGNELQEEKDYRQVLDQPGPEVNDLSLDPTTYYISFRHKVVESDQPLSRIAAELRRDDPGLRAGAAQFRMDIHRQGDPALYRFEVPCYPESMIMGTTLRAIEEVTGPTVEPTGILIKVEPGSATPGMVTGGKAMVYYGVGKDADVFVTRDEGWFQFTLTGIDREEGSASGTFRFVATNERVPDDPRTLVVTDGRFHLPLE